MKKSKLIAGGLLLALSGLSSAATVLDVSGTLKGFVDSDSYTFTAPVTGTYDVDFTATDPTMTYTIFSIFGNAVKAIDTVVGSSVFDFAGTAGTQYKAVIGDISLTSSTVNYNLDITDPVPEPKTWALMMLGIGFVLYQARPGKKHGSVSIPG